MKAKIPLVTWYLSKKLRFSFYLNYSTKEVPAFNCTEVSKVKVLRNFILYFISFCIIYLLFVLFSFQRHLCLKTKTRWYTSTARRVNISLRPIASTPLLKGRVCLQCRAWMMNLSIVKLWFQLFKLASLVNKYLKRHSELNIFVKYDRLVLKNFLIHFLSIYSMSGPGSGGRCKCRYFIVESTKKQWKQKPSAWTLNAREETYRL